MLVFLTTIVVVETSCSKTGAGPSPTPPPQAPVPTVSFTSVPTMVATTDSLPRGDSITVTAALSTGATSTIKVRPLKDTILNFSILNVTASFPVRVKSRSAVHNLLISGKYNVIAKSNTILSTGEVVHFTVSETEKARTMKFRDEFLGSGWFDESHGDYTWQYWNKETEIEIGVQPFVAYDKRLVFKFNITPTTLVMERITGEGATRTSSRVTYMRSPL